jgi:hypothetical protein
MRVRNRTKEVGRVLGDECVEDILISTDELSRGEELVEDFVKDSLEPED